MTTLPGYEEKTRVVAANACGYAVFDETDEWPFPYFQIAGLQIVHYPSVAGLVECHNGTIGPLQGSDFFSVQSNAFYYHVGTPGAPAIGIYYFPIDYRIRRVRINKCGYVVVKLTDTFPHNLLVSIGSILFDPSKYPIKTGTPRCVAPRKREAGEAPDYSIGYQQGLRFFANESFWHFVNDDPEIVGMEIDLYYLPIPKVVTP